MARNESSKKLLADVQGVINRYPDLRMTVRQIYYRLVAAQKLPNSMSSYNKVKRILTEARLNGEVSFDSIEDRTRTIIGTKVQYEPVSQYTKSWEDYIRQLDVNYDLPRWHGQPKRVIVLVEKQALQGLFMDVCEEHQVDLLVCRGYPSITVLHKLARSFKGTKKDVILLYFGDYDPSGLDIDRNVEERLRENFGAKFFFERQAITLEQIEEYDIPPAPAKDTDSRTKGMEERLGEAMQVELDAIDPPDLQQIIADRIEQHFDSNVYLGYRNDVLNENRKQIREWLSDLLADGNPRDDDEDDETED